MIDLLFPPASAGYAIFVFSFVIALGVAVGHVKIGGVQLGVTGVLFSGLLFGHFHWTVESAFLEFARDFGLILFVYTIGLQVGPGFVSSVRRQGLKLNLLAASIVFLGALLTVFFIKAGVVSTAAGAGLFSGATTNTPSLGAGQEAIKSSAYFLPQDYQLTSLAYAIAYPFGIMGTILVMVFMKVVFKINVETEAKRFEEESGVLLKATHAINLIVENPSLQNLMIKEIPFLKGSPVVIARHMHNDVVSLAKPDTRLQAGDVVRLVGPKNALKEVEILIGSQSPIDLKVDVESELTTRRIIVTNSHFVGKTIQELVMKSMYDVTVTRIQRSDVEFTATSDVTLQMGDNLRVVGHQENLNKLAVLLGDSIHELRKPQLLPLFIGIAAGLFLGSIPLYFPGIPAPIKLGLAGGPLLAAIFFSNLKRLGPVIWYMPETSNLMLREFGIVLFLTAVGLRAGDKFVATFLEGSGFLWFILGVVITILPSLIILFIGRKFLKMNYLTLCGLLAGSMTNPPALAFANSQGISRAVSLSYANVYPMVMMLRVICAQLIVFMIH
jgi:putative transport protein